MLLGSLDYKRITHLLWQSGHLEALREFPGPQIQGFHKTITTGKPGKLLDFSNSLEPEKLAGPRTMP